MALKIVFNPFLQGNFQYVQTGGSGSGATLTQETPVGAVNGSNTTYTVSHTPVFVEIDGQIRVDGYGYSYSAGTIEVDAFTPPSQSIQSFYNAT